MSVEIVWRRNVIPAAHSAAGWNAFVGDVHVGTVYGDGEAYFGNTCLSTGSPYLAARALVRYVEAGGR